MRTGEYHKSKPEGRYYSTKQESFRVPSSHKRIKSGARDKAIQLYRKALERDSKIRYPEYLRTKYLWSAKAMRDGAPLLEAAADQ